MDLDTGWHVDGMVARPAGATGGCFSDAYRVSRADGAQGFLKALDFSRALDVPDPVPWFQAFTTAYLFERDILAACDARRLDRIVRSIAHGYADVDQTPLLGRVPYIIFERAEQDVGSALILVGTVDLAWRLRSLHHVATALFQLHQNGIAHQDVKASNVLLFKSAGSKVADLGCASVRGGSAPRDGLAFAGDPAHAAPEGLYGYVDPEWNVRRIGCDAYHLGSLLVFLFSQASMTALLYAGIPEPMRPEHGVKFEEALPHLQTAFSSAVATVETAFPTEVKSDLSAIVRELCYPDPRERGRTRKHLERIGPLTMQRYVTRFDFLARRAEALVRRA
ncbi:MAG: hypothetical protein IT460_11420 [Planctomycetes bacterium]|nr:hypothetical protein [Planctomycetota bacterium]